MTPDNFTALVFVKRSLCVMCEVAIEFLKSISVKCTFLSFDTEYIQHN